MQRVLQLESELEGLREAQRQHHQAVLALLNQQAMNLLMVQQQVMELQQREHTRAQAAKQHAQQSTAVSPQLEVGCSTAPNRPVQLQGDTPPRTPVGIRSLHAVMLQDKVKVVRKALSMRGVNALLAIPSLEYNVITEPSSKEQ